MVKTFFVVFLKLLVLVGLKILVLFPNVLLGLLERDLCLGGLVLGLLCYFYLQRFCKRVFCLR